MARLKRTKDLPALVGVKEACEILGINRMTLHRWQESRYFAIEPARAGSYPVWTRDDIEEFARTRTPRSTGPAPQAKRSRAAA